MNTKIIAVVMAAGISIAVGCATTKQIPPPNAVVAPNPIEGNTAQFFAPYTSDGVVAKWVDKGMGAKLGAAVGSTVGGTGARIAAKTALSAIPFAGLFAGMAGDAVGDAAGRKIAIEAAGGWDYIRSTSDLSFDRLEDMVVWMYATYGTSEHYQQVVDLVGEIYTDVPKNYRSWIAKAPRRSQR